MKQITSVIKNLNKKQLSVMTVSLFSLWLLGPFVAVGKFVPLGSIFTRLFISAILLGSLFYVKFKLIIQNYFVNLKSDFLSLEAKNELTFLRNTLRDAVYVIHRSLMNFFFLKYKKPWFLVLGPSGGGKTTLLTKADLSLKGLDNLPPTAIIPTKYVNWFHSEQTVFIDIGGRYLQSESTAADENNFILSRFFRLIKRYRRLQPLNGVILSVNLQELIANPKQQAQLKKINFLIQELLKLNDNIPIYLLLTRCDLIEGFADFFEDLGPEERNQTFGLSFPLTTQPQSLPQLFDDEYNALLQRLHDRVLARINQENNLEKQGKIKNFPLQMEFLKAPLAKLLNIVLPNTHLNLRGIYFLSLLQKDPAFDNLTQSLSRAFDLQPLRTSFRAGPSKTFFVNDLFKRIILPESKYFNVSSNQQNKSFLTSLLILIISGTCLFFFYRSYQENFFILNKTKTTLNQLANKPHTQSLFSDLNLLQTIMNQLNYTGDKWYLKFGLQQVNRLKGNADSLYLKLLRTQFLSYIQQTLENQLQTTREDNPSQLYAALKCYLLLGHAKKFDTQFFQNYMNNYWQNNIHNQQKIKLLNMHLNNLLANDIPKIYLNDSYIANARQILNNLSSSKLALTILQNQYPKPNIKLYTSDDNSVLRNIPVEISGIYKLTNFHEIYYQQIPKTCQEISTGDWVLGKQQNKSFMEFSTNQLITEVRAIYLSDYAAVWSDIFAKIKIDDLQNLHQIVEIIDLLNRPNSPLIQLLNSIKTNTLPLSNSIEFNQQVSSRFLNLSNLSADILKNTNQTSLSNLRDYLSKIDQVTDIDRASYEAAKQRMDLHGENDAITGILHQSRLLPEPLQTWYTTIAAESWHILLKNTQNYLNRIWTATVYPQYEAMLDKRYPLFKEATTDLSLSDFTNFFAINGTMDSFFKNYLQPFVDDTRLYWEWKNVDGQRINISQASLEMFIRAALIQKMFFPENSKSPTISFSLIPVELANDLRSFSLDLEGQSVVFQKDNEQITSLTWPGPQPNHVELNFMDDTGKKATLMETGPWAFFKILDKSHLEATANPKHYKLTFDLNGKLVQYDLFTSGVVNPFIPGILSAFRCPESL